MFHSNIIVIVKQCKKLLNINKHVVALLPRIHSEIQCNSQ